ncbi:putative zinc-binding metallopeptidase [Roseateles sp. SL47]|uniref:zinc-binding metallopeptidase family protein n=1 Tax=Roseateles sp. SL47 TaxID=2995138 RepID=UPI00226DB2AC|nr:putative zinc-binding metallopeptidase [Roseateles sp. SL47]WAC74746.1 putative zinc-binding metallopeptidase [Roseateles sp. SL47]
MTSTLARNYQCSCGKPVFFRNSSCLSCGSALGYVADEGALYALRSAEAPDRFYLDGRRGIPYRRCQNFSSAIGCNWLVRDDGGATAALCLSCRLSRIIPDQSYPGNAELWRRMESAKRRMVSQLIGLGLPVVPKADDPARGLAFDFLHSEPGAPVMTGHAGGVITINIEEADDAFRERARVQFGEPYRTLLGHLRHEVGHYYWDRLVVQTAWLTPFRELFGDERQDYAAALKRHYDAGPQKGWKQRFISAYAGAHPWEDWAETWAHYLHLRDTLDTAQSFGMVVGAQTLDSPDGRGPGGAPFLARDLWRQDHPTGLEFLSLLRDWVAVTCVMNEMSRAMGQPDFYPFVLPAAVVAKLHFIHCLIDAHSDAPSASAQDGMSGVAT